MKILLQAQLKDTNSWTELMVDVKWVRLLVNTELKYERVDPDEQTETDEII